MRITPLRALLELAFGFVERSKARLSARDLLRHIHCVGDLLAVLGFGQRHQLLDFLPQSLFNFLNVAPAQRAMLARIGPELAAVHADLAKLEHAHFARQH